MQKLHKICNAQNVLLRFFDHDDFYWFQLDGLFFGCVFDKLAFLYLSISS